MRRATAARMVAVAGVVGVVAGGLATTALADRGSPAAPSLSAVADTAPMAVSASSAIEASSGHPYRAWLARRGLHGEFVTHSDGGYRTIGAQRGTVSAVSGSSLTIRSDDGYTVSYTVTDETIVRHGRDRAKISDVKVGDTVGVVAGVDGSTRSAVRLFVPAG
ncbi:MULTISPECIES: hypothetical protein [Protofrankia]|uniref:Uncharacterized protein n=1 Tax=Candidatus Protofrankia datiscae TaxID=2716812 RepID=F8AUR2_9ACTN|nr:MULTISPECIES: hypothetical protein [Protofrankia]AEH08106.1 hypothetical protein FsymDg_0576 [Candidatus Protofrankia datiscae]